MSLNVLRWTSRPVFYGISMRNIKLSPLYLRSAKNLHTSPVLLCLSDGGKGIVKPTQMQKRILVWTKAYASVNDVPERVTRMQMYNAMDRFRVRVLMGMMAATMVLSAIAVYFGKKGKHERYQERQKNLQK